MPLLSEAMTVDQAAGRIAALAGAARVKAAFDLDPDARNALIGGGVGAGLGGLAGLALHLRSGQTKKRPISNFLLGAGLGGAAGAGIGLGAGRLARMGSSADPVNQGAQDIQALQDSYGRLDDAGKDQMATQAGVTRPEFEKKINYQPTTLEQARGAAGKMVDEVRKEVPDTTSLAKRVLAPDAFGAGRWSLPATLGGLGVTDAALTARSAINRGREAVRGALADPMVSRAGVDSVSDLRGIARGVLHPDLSADNARRAIDAARRGLPEIEGGGLLGRFGRIPYTRRSVMYGAPFAASHLSSLFGGQTPDETKARAADLAQGSTALQRIQQRQQVGR